MRQEGWIRVLNSGPGDQAINVENSLACDFGCLIGAVYKF